ncbi:MAG: helix-turn-helix transcriptional regulator [Clostridia bacterium]|nr:helix-turn-helix transcriptional regulator [Clostridia bacterium]
MEIGLSRTSSQNWRNHNSKPGTDALIKIANYFNVSVDYLVGRETPATKQESNNTNKAVNSPLLNRIESLDELQQAKVMAYIDGLQDTKSNSIIAQAVERGMNNKQKDKSKIG